jgi:hypothetical protein
MADGGGQMTDTLQLTIGAAVVDHPIRRNRHVLLSAISPPPSAILLD